MWTEIQMYTDINYGKPKIAIILNVPGSRNPMLHFALDALRENYQISVITPDLFEKASSYPGVSFENFHRSLVFANALLRPIWFFVGILLQILNRLFQVLKLRSLIIKPLDAKAVLNFQVIERLLIPILVVPSLLAIGRLRCVICIDAGASVSARILKRIKRIPYAYWIYEVYPNQNAEKLKCLEALMGQVERLASKDAHIIIEPARPFGKLIRRRYGLHRVNCETIWTCPKSVKESAPTETGKNVKFYYHGIYVPNRGLENLISAMEYVEGGVLYLRGFGILEETLRDLVKQKSLQDRVQFLDPVPVDQLSHEATKFDVGVVMVCMTSSNAKFVIGFKSFENITAGLPLVAPSSFPLRWLVTKYKVGMLYPDCAVHDLASVLRYCTEHPEVVSEWKGNSRRLAESEVNRRFQGRRLNEIVGSMISPQN